MAAAVSAVASVWPAVTLSPTATATVFTNQVLLPAPFDAADDEDASCGSEPKASPYVALALSVPLATTSVAGSETAMEPCLRQKLHWGER